MTTLHTTFKPSSTCSPFLWCPFIMVMEPLMTLMEPLLILTLQPHASKSPTKIKFLLRYETYLTLFNFLIQPSENFSLIFHEPKIWQVFFLSPNKIVPCSSLKPKNHSLCGNIWKDHPESMSHSLWVILVDVVRIFEDLKSWGSCVAIDVVPPSFSPFFPHFSLYLILFFLKCPSWW